MGRTMMSYNAFGKIDHLVWTPTMNTGGTDAGDVAAATERITDLTDTTITMMQQDGGTAILENVVVYDKDDVASGDYDIYILRTDVALGTEDAAISITDANMTEILAVISCTTWEDLINSKVCVDQTNLGITLRAPNGVSDLYGAVVDRAGVTATATGFVVRFGLVYT